MRRTIGQRQTKIPRIVEEARRICTNLRPASLEVVGLIQTIKGRITELEDYAPFLIHLETVGTERPDFSEDVIITLYRFFNECLMNILKHAQADQVKL